MSKPLNNAESLLWTISTIEKSKNTLNIYLLTLFDC